MNLLSPRGAKMYPELLAGLARLNCPEDEECSLHVTESPNGGISVLVKLQGSRLMEQKWAMDHDPAAGRYTYQRVFETDSPTTIIDELKRILDLPRSS
jgi:hypothetical protein